MCVRWCELVCVVFFFKKRLKMVTSVVGKTLRITDYYATELGEDFATYKTAQFGVWNIHLLEWR